ncbi:UvrD-helicase domain-containing protein [Pseudomonas putida]|uniref:UvrD-helicase domain-containing protein n=1 Tax=Pseudomonas putida TaxID=303 RepID=UPI00382D15EC
MSNPIKVALGDGFLQSFAAIPRGKQKKVMEFVTKFRQNPRSTGINYETINDAQDSNFRSVRIDQEYRGIVLKPERGDVYVLLWVDKHDDAYDWARRNRCSIHPQTGVLQLFAVDMNSTPASEPRPVAPRTPLPVADAVAEVAQPRPPLFQLDDALLLRLGVPEESLPLVRALTCEEELEALDGRLPIEAFEALYLLAAGTDLEQVLADYAVAADAPVVDTEDFSGALERAASLRRFHVVEDELELIQMLEAPLERWRVFLHPSQRQLVERDWNGPVRVLGGAGTGKTVVAMHRARWLVSRLDWLRDEHLLFTTFTSNLAVDIQENLRKICTPEQLERIEVRNLDAWVSKFVKRHGYEAKIVYPGGRDGDYERCWDQAIQLTSAELGLPPSFYREEWERVVLPQRINARQAYLTAGRTGRGVALNRKQRADIWPVFEEMRLQLAQHKLVTAEDAIHDAIDLIERGVATRRYRALVVDEGQDFGPEAMSLLRHLVPEQKNDLFIVGDGHQRIYQRRSSLSQCGISIRGRGKKLRINYRTTEEIRRFAVALLEGIEVDDLDGGVDGLRDYCSLAHGEAPQVHVAANEAAECAWLVGEIRSLSLEGIVLEDMCLVARTNGLLNGYERALQGAGIETRRLSRQQADDRSKPGVRLATMHRIKGLEFRCVFMVGINDDVVPLARAGQSSEDPVEQRLLDLNERALFHVAATRAVKHLLISCHGRRSPYLQ